MINKFSEEYINNNYLKNYITDDPINIIEFINQLQNNNMNIKKIKLYENADIGLKTFHGEYTLDNFLLIYNKINLQEIENISIYISNNINIIIDNTCRYISLFSNENIEINDLLTNYSKTHI